jgi:hypothetical protein
METRQEKISLTNPCHLFAYLSLTYNVALHFHMVDYIHGHGHSVGLLEAQISHQVEWRESS